MANLHPWSRRGNTIDFIQHIRASASRIWSALTTPDGLHHWLRVSGAEMPAEVGATFTLYWESMGDTRSSSGKNRLGVRTGQIRDFQPSKLLALEWVLPCSNVVTQLSFQIQPSFALFGESREEECDLWLIHSGFPEDGVGLFEFDGHHRHWRQDIGTLAAWLEERPGKPTPYALAGVQFVGGAPNVGLLVSYTFPGSPAHTAGIRTGDIICAVDGHALHSLDDFHDWIDERVPGEVGIFSLADRQVSVTVESVEQARRRFLIRCGDGWVERFDLPDRQKAALGAVDAD